MPDERFALLVNLGKKITDYHVDHDKMDEGTELLKLLIISHHYSVPVLVQRFLIIHAFMVCLNQMKSLMKHMVLPCSLMKKKRYVES